MPEDHVSARELAEWLGISDRSVRLAADRETVARVNRGAYALKASVQRYCAHLREVAAGRGGEQGVMDLAQQRARLAKEQADAVEMKNDQLRGGLVRADEVERTWSDILRGVQAHMLAVGTKVQHRLPGLTRHDVEQIDQTIREALEEASRGGSPT